MDVSFAVHADFVSHTGTTMSFEDGKGTVPVQSLSRKQKLSRNSSTKAELVGVNDISVMILWTKLFLEAQKAMWDP